MSEMTLQQALDLARQHHQAGQWPAADSIYRQVLAIQPNNAEALHLLGVLALQKGDPSKAVELIRQAIAVNPSVPSFHCNLGQALVSAGQISQAIQACQQALQLRSDYPEALNNLGAAYQQSGQLDQAIDSYRQAIAVRAQFPEPHHNLSTALLQQRKGAEALEQSQQALKLRPDYPDALNGLGNALKWVDRLEESAEAYRQTLRLVPNHVEAQNNLGNTLREMGRLDEAAEAYRRAIGLEPNLGSAHFNLGLAYLLQGRFEQGWIEHEWRWQTPDLAPFRQDFSQPQWDGSPLEGRTILLHAEQGFGDTIQFVRYAPIVRERGGKVVLAVPTELRSLLEGFEGVDQLVAHGDERQAFDLHCPLLSLPLAMKTTLETIPANAPYLHADPQKQAQWNTRLPGDDLKVGLAWAGRETHIQDRHRSMSFESIRPILDTQGARFVSLQKWMTNRPEHPLLIDLTDELTDFSDAAALIANLDLVVTVDTAVAHLAGAMGKPAWVMIQHIPDWRWLLDRSDSPWYPSLRLFRQSARGDWAGVVARIVSELRGWIDRHGRP